jgi:hypothetical protein
VTIPAPNGSARVRPSRSGLAQAVTRPPPTAAGQGEATGRSPADSGGCPAPGARGPPPDQRPGPPPAEAPGPTVTVPQARTHRDWQAESLPVRTPTVTGRLKLAKRNSLLIQLEFYLRPYYGRGQVPRPASSRASPRVSVQTLNFEISARPGRRCPAGAQARRRGAWEHWQGGRGRVSESGCALDPEWIRSVPVIST